MANEDPELREIEKEFEALTDEIPEPREVRVKCSGKPGVAVIDQVRAVAKERLTSLIESVSAQELKAVEDALREVLELD